MADPGILSHGIRRVLRTGADLLTDRQCGRLSSVFAADEHAAVEATWGIYQRIVQAYRNPDRVAAKQQLTAVIQDLAGNVPASLTEVITLGRTLKRRAGDVLAYFDLPDHMLEIGGLMAASRTLPRGTALDLGPCPRHLPDPSSTPADSDPCYTVKCDEPHLARDRTVELVRAGPLPPPRSVRSQAHMEGESKAVIHSDRVPSVPGSATHQQAPGSR